MIFSVNEQNYSHTMNILKCNLYILSALCFVAWKQTDEVKKVSLYQNQFSIEVPVSWQYKEKYRKYSNYQVKYDAKISEVKTKTLLTVDVYDSSHMYNAPINNEMLDSFKEVQFKTKGPSIKFIERKVVKVHNNDLGFLKYTFQGKNEKIHYGGQLFFRTSDNNFYEIEVYSLSMPLEECKEIIEDIIKSIHFH
jgi:hypothetical protein